MSDYTPTTEEVRDSYAADYANLGTYADRALRFDRWLAHIKDSAYWEGYGDGQDSERAFG